MAQKPQFNGTSYNDVLNGTTGADKLSGGKGDDLYTVNHAQDEVIEKSNEGVDTVLSAVTYTLSAHVENLTLTGASAINATGNSQNNILVGNAAANVLNGGTGADDMAGDDGDDTYVVDNAGDVVREEVDEGTDTVLSSISYALGAHLENLTLTGSASLTGTGNALGNVLTGNAGANLLDGGAGADSMAGGGGNDTYVVDDAGDLVTEAADQGTDTVQSSISYALGAHVEKLVLTGTDAVDGTGNSLANSLTGNSAANILDGAAGADSMAGGAGDDTYIVDQWGDAVTEDADQGIDTVRSAVGYVLGAHVENLTLTNAGIFSGVGIGNALDNAIVGTYGINILAGRGGNDVMTGGGGLDYIDGGSGIDTAVYTGEFLDHDITPFSLALGLGGHDWARDEDDDRESAAGNPGPLVLTGVVVTDLRGGSPDGKDYVRNVEALRFDDRLIYLDGRNNAAILSADTRSLTETNAAADLNAQGRLTIVDFESAERTFIAQTGTAGRFGTFSIGADGTWTYTSATAHDEFADGQTDTDVFDVQSADGTRTSVTIRITGTNDQPVAVADTGDVNEDAVLAGTVAANDSDVDDGATLSYALNAPVAGLALNADGSYSFDASHAAYQHLAQGALTHVVAGYAVTDEHGASDSAMLSLAVTGVNDAPVITGGVTTGAVREDVTASATGQLIVLDPDDNASMSWTVVGGTASGNADYHFRADSFTLTRNDALLFHDDFADGSPPFSAPGFANGNPTTYGGVGSFGEAAGRLLIDSSGAAPFVGVGTPDPIIGQEIVVRSNIDPSNLDAGLKSNADFSVVGVFDLVLPDSSREAYGIRVSDRLLGASVNPPPQFGDDMIELVVTKQASGSLRVQLREIDFVNGESSTLQSLALNPPAGADQIRLQLDHSISDIGALRGSFEFLANGSVLSGSNQAFTQVGRIFGTETPGFAGDDENWTRATLVARAPALSDSVLGGEFGTLNVNQAGAWTYTLDNSRTVTQNLAQGESAEDVFTARVVDEEGGFDEQTVTITVSGTNDRPVMQTAAATVGIAEDSNAPHLIVTGLSGFSDVDLSDGHSVAPMFQTATLSNGAPIPPGLESLLVHALDAAITERSTGDGQGSVTWNFRLANDAVQFLARNQTLTLGYSIVLTDTAVGSAAQPVTIVVTGTNDAPVVASPDGVRLVSSSTSGEQGNQSSYFEGFISQRISADGSRIVFDSYADNLVGIDANDGAPGSPDNGGKDVFVKDVRTGEVFRASESAAGADSAVDSRMASISANGRYVAFSSPAGNFVTGDTNALSDVFLKDLQTGEVRLVSTSAAGGSADGSSFQPVVSQDGRYVAFYSDASSLTGLPATQTYVVVKDMQTGGVSVLGSAGGLFAANQGLGIGISADGGKVVFGSTHDGIVAGDANALTDIFVHDRVSGLTELVNTSGGVQLAGHNFSPAISANGRFVSFERESQTFVKDLETGALTRASLNDDGIAGNARSFAATLSADGRYAAFMSAATNLVADDTNGHIDVFVKDLASGSIVRLSLGADGEQGNGDSTSPMMSADGRSITFVTGATNLTANDANGASFLDVVVARNPLLPDAAADFAAAVTERVTPVGDLTGSGTFAFSDVDLADVHQVSPDGTPLGPVLGALSAAKVGDTTGAGTGGQIAWIYNVAASALEHLAEGETRTERFTISLDDQHGGIAVRRIDVSIIGTNDAPELGAVGGGTLTDTSAYDTFTDASAPHAGVSEFTTHAAFAAQAGGATVIDFDDRAHGDGLALEQAYIGRGLVINQRDGGPLNLLAPGDNAFFPANNFNSAPNALTSSGAAAGSADASDNIDFVLVRPASAAGLYVGNIGNSEGGSTRVQFLGAGELVIAEKVLVPGDPDVIGTGYDNRLFYGITSDRLIERIRIVEPAGDGDELTFDDVQFVTAGALSGRLAATDVDTGAVLSYGLASGEDGESTYGVLTVAANGAWTYAGKPAALNALSAASAIDDVFAVQVTDQHGALSTSTLVVHLEGANDAPTGIRLSPAHVFENASGALVGVLSTADTDNDDTHVYAVSDDRFEILDGALKLKDGVSLDHEAESSVTLTITATDAGGLQRSENFTIAVADVAEPVFTQAADIVDFNVAPTSLFTDGTQYDALGGDDIVTLPDTPQSAAAWGYPHNPQFYGGAGNDTIIASGPDAYSSAIIDGGTGDDAITLGSAFGATLLGNDGNDTIIGSQTAYQTFYLATVDGGSGDDYIEAFWVQSSVVLGGSGNDEIDAIVVTDGATLDGGEGDDRIEVFRAGSVTLLGGDGDDTIVGTAEDAWTFLVVTVDGGAGEDTIDAYWIASSTILGGADADTFNATYVSDGASVDGGTGNDTFNIANAFSATLLGGEGDDTFAFGGATSIIDGGSGNDLIVVDPLIIAAHTINGGTGADTLRYSGAAQALDLRALPGANLAGIERIDLTGSGDNALTLDKQTLLALSNETDALFVTGDAGDSVEVDLTQRWHALGNTTIDGLQFAHYGARAAELFVQAGISVAISLAPALDDEVAGTLIDTHASDIFEPLTGALTGRGIDDDAVLTYAFDVAEDGASAYGTLTITSEGLYAFTPNADAINTLAEIDPFDEVFAVTVTDEAGAVGHSTITVAIDGANDLPAILPSFALPGVVTELEGAASQDIEPITGTLHVFDFDIGNTLTASIVGSPVIEWSGGEPPADVAAALTASGVLTFEGMTISDGGTRAIGWTYDPDPVNLDFLGSGQTLRIRYAVQVSDGTDASASEEVTITIHGTNDGPVAIDDSANDPVLEAGTAGGNVPIPGAAYATGNVLANDADLDLGDGLEVIAVYGVNGIGNAGAAVAGRYGTLIVAADGNYEYTLDDTDDETQALSESIGGVEFFDHVVQDSSGATSWATLTISISGSNDAPIALADTVDAVENEAISLDVLANDVDPDVDDALTLVYAYLAPEQGFVSIADNRLLFDSGAALDSIALNDSDTVNVDYAVADLQGAFAFATASISVAGRNDNPTARVDTASGDENAEITIDVLANDSDIDRGDQLTLLSGASLHGTVEVLDNRLVFKPGNGYDYIADGAIDTALIEYVVADQHGAQATGTVEITLTGTNDAPTLVVPESPAATVRASLTAAGTQASSVSWLYGPDSISGDGGSVVFVSIGAGLIAADTNPHPDTYLRDLVTGATVLLSNATTAGVAGNNASFYGAISESGRFVAFESDASNLVSNDLNGRRDIFVKDLQTGLVTVASSAAGGAFGNNMSFFGSISGDGRYVAFNSYADNLVSDDTNGVRDIFVKDMQTGVVTRASSTAAGVGGQSESIQPTISEDGRYVAFWTLADNLTDGAPNGTYDVVVKDLQTGALATASRAGDGSIGNGASSGAAISADGRYVAFSSLAGNLVSGDTNGSVDLFVKDMQTGIVTIASSSAGGEIGNGGSSHAAISGDGRFVVFHSSATNLVAGDGNAIADVFVKDVQTGAIARVSDAALNGQSANASISADGRYITFQSSAASLVPNDTNGIDDVFVAANPLLPRGLATVEDSPGIAITGMSVGDVDSIILTVALSARHGALGVADTAGLMTVDGNGTGALVLTGTPAAINAALASSLVYVPQPDYHGVDAITAVAGDGDKSVTRTVPVTVAPLNDRVFIDEDASTTTAAVVELANGSTGENVALHTTGGVITYTDADVDDVHGASVTPQDTGYLGELTLAAVDQGGNAVEWTFSVPDSDLDPLAAGEQRVQHYAVSVSDGKGASASAVVTITIAGSADNAFPSVVGESFALHEDTSYRGNVLDNDSDPDADALTVSTAGTLTTVGGGTVVLEADGSFGYTPAADRIGDDTFTYGVTDGNGGFGYAEVSLAIIPVNDTPLIHGVDVPTPMRVVSTDANGAPADSGHSNLYPATLFSADNRYLAFYSRAGNLTADAGLAGNTDVFVKNLVTGEIVLASGGLNGVEGNGHSFARTLSADGRHVAFDSGASNLVTGDSNDVSDVFVTDVQTGIITLASLGLGGAAANGASNLPAVSADGRHVAFYSNASNLTSGDDNAANDIFVRDLASGTTVRASTAAGGQGGNADSLAPAISADGRYVAFFSSASNLVVGDTNGVADVFVKDLQTGSVERVTEGPFGQANAAAAFSVALSADARFVAFVSGASNLVPGDTNGAFDVFVKDLQAGTIARATTSAQGAEGNAGGLFPTISNNGRFVAFHSSSTNLVPNDATGTNPDVYIKDLHTGAVVRFGGNAPGIFTWFAAISADGRYIAFRGRDALLIEGDTNQYEDVVVAPNPLAFTISGTATAEDSTTLVRGISVSDVDSDTAPLGVTLAVGNGALALESSESLVFTDSDGTDGTLAFSGSQAAINTALAAGIVYTPATNYNGTDLLNFTLDDGGASGAGGPQFASAQIPITVTPANDAPVAGDDAFLAVENAVLTGNVLANDTDVDNDTLQAVAGTFATAHGTVAIQANGMFAYTPHANYIGPDGFTYTLRDARGGSDTASVTLDVQYANRAPVVTSSVVNPDLARNGSFESAVHDPGAGLVTYGGGSTDIYEWHVTGYNIDHIGGYWQAAHGGRSLDLSGSLPGGVRQIVDTVPGANYTVTFALAANPDWGRTQSVRTWADGIHMGDHSAFSPSRADMQWTDRSFTFTASGTQTWIQFESLHFDAVGPALDNVRMSRNGLYVNEDTTLAFGVAHNRTFSVSDVDAGAGELRVSLTSANGGFSLADTTGVTFVDADGSDGALVFTAKLPDVNNALNSLVFAPGHNFFGTASFNVAVNDQGNTGAGAAQVANHTRNVTVHGVQDAPIAVDDVFATPHHQPLALMPLGLLGNDIEPDNEAKALASVFNPTMGSVSYSGGVVTFTPVAGYHGEASFDYVVVDPHGASDVGHATVSVLRTNAAPAIAISYPNLINNGNFEDPAAGVFTYHASQVMAGWTVIDGSIDHISGQWQASSGARSVDLNGNSQGAIYQTIHAAPGVQYTAYFDMAGNPHREPGYYVGPEGSTYDPESGLWFVPGEDNAIIVPPIYVDPNDYWKELRVSAAGDAAVHSYNYEASSAGDMRWSRDRSFTFTAGSEFESIQLQSLKPGASGPALDNVRVFRSGSVLITPEDTALVVDHTEGMTIRVSDDALASAPMLLVLSAEHGDPALGNAAGLSIVDGDASDGTASYRGTVSDINSALPSLRYTPDHDYFGSDTLTITVHDEDTIAIGAPQSASRGLSVNVLARGEVPVAEDDGPYAVEQNLSLTIAVADLLANDHDDDGDALAFAPGTATNGTVALSGSNVIFTPTAGHQGTASFTYTVTDQHGSDEATVSVNVLPRVILSIGAHTAGEAGTAGANGVSSGYSNPPAGGGAGAVAATAPATGSQPAAAVLAGDITPDELTHFATSAGGTGGAGGTAGNGGYFYFENNNAWEYRYDPSFAPDVFLPGAAGGTGGQGGTGSATASNVGKASLTGLAGPDVLVVRAETTSGAGGGGGAGGVGGTGGPHYSVNVSWIDPDWAGSLDTVLGAQGGYGGTGGRGGDGGLATAIVDDNHVDGGSEADQIRVLASAQGASGGSGGRGGAGGEGASAAELYWSSVGAGVGGVGGRGGDGGDAFAGITDNTIDSGAGNDLIELVSRARGGAGSTGGDGGDAGYRTELHYNPGNLVFWNSQFRGTSGAGGAGGGGGAGYAEIIGNEVRTGAGHDQVTFEGEIAGGSAGSGGASGHLGAYVGHTFFTPGTPGASGTSGAPGVAALKIADNFVDTGDGDDSVEFVGRMPVGATPLIIGNVLFAGNGNDVLSFAGLSVPVDVDLGAGGFTVNNAAGNVFSGFERVIGGSGDDRIAGSGSDPVLTGGAGSDTFVLRISSHTITDFMRGSGGDKLDLREILTGYDGDIARFVKLSPGASTVVAVNPDGLGTDFAGIATLAGVSFHENLLNELVSQGNLITA